MQKKKKGGLIIKIFLFGLAVYYLFTMTSLQIQNKEKRDQEQALRKELESQLLLNEELQNTLDAEVTDEYILKFAREKLGLALPNEKVFINPVE